MEKHNTTNIKATKDHQKRGELIKLLGKETLTTGEKNRFKSLVNEIIQTDKEKPYTI